MSCCPKMAYILLINLKMLNEKVKSMTFAVFLRNYNKSTKKLKEKA